jgi:hypothetical protein
VAEQQVKAEHFLANSAGMTAAPAPA